MGVVYKARQKGLDRSVAVKMILAGQLASPELVRRFQTEAKAAARLRHSNIVHIHDVGQVDGQDFFAMEYIDGPSLAERIPHGPVDFPTAVRLMAAVARAVEHLHQQGIVHRDLKPSNILLDADGQPFVTDFGLAKVFAAGGNLTATGVIAGTPSYMAPEQASGRRDARQPGERRLQPRRDPLRVADRPAPFPCRNSVGHADGRAQRRSGHAANAQSARAAGTGTDLPEMSGQGARGAIRVGGRVGRRSGSFCPRRRVGGSPAHAASTILELDAASAGVGLSIRRPGHLLRDRNGELLFGIGPSTPAITVRCR